MTVRPESVAFAARRRVAFADLGRQLRQGAGDYAGVGTVLVALVLVLSVTQPRFATYNNWINILETSAVLLVLSIGLTFVLLVGGFDLSLGGFLALGGVILAKLIDAGVPTGLAIACVVVGACCAGAIMNGVPIALGGLSSFVVTLATASITGGVALLLTSAVTQDLFGISFLRTLGNGGVATVPYILMVAAAVLLASLAVTRYTGFGRMIYVVGGNLEAARLAGLRVNAVRISAYAICGGLAGCAAIMNAGRLGSADPAGQAGIELTAAAAVLVGGTSFVGGHGGMFGTFLGTLFLGVLSNGLTLASISTFWQPVIAGVVLLSAVSVDRLRRSRRPRPFRRRART
jgi:ribose transport system permease protein